MQLVHTDFERALFYKSFPMFFKHIGVGRQTGYIEKFNEYEQYFYQVSRELIENELRYMILFDEIICDIYLHIPAAPKSMIELLSFIFGTDAPPIICSMEKIKQNWGISLMSILCDEDRKKFNERMEFLYARIY